MKKGTVLFILSLFISSFAFCQQNEKEASYSDTEIREQRSIILDNDSDTEEVMLYMEEGTKSFRISIKSLVQAGKLTIQILDPQGKKQGNYSVGTLMNSKKQEEIMGNLEKRLKEPEAGVWKIKIIPVDVKGQIRIETIMLQ